MKRIRYIALGCVALCVLTACTPAVREARHTVAIADSLWRAGMPCDDSIALAQTFTTLDTYPFLYPDDYAHACYHYGRLLREKENPVEAMQVFINATHSHSKDFAILGRVYSNMGSICHLAEEYPLSYDMYERSAECFLRNGDSIAYYYALNDMAFELAEQELTDKSLSLLAIIENNTSSKGVLALVQETKADAYLKAEQYDSAIYYANQSYQLGNDVPTCTIIKAQAFSKLEKEDSALYYANIVLAHPYASFQNQFNALYIVSHFDSTLCSDEVRTLTSQREDIRYYEYEPEKEILSQAIQLLLRDLNRKPDWRAYLTIAVLLISVIVFVALSIVWKNRKRQMHEHVASLADQQATNMINSIKQHIRTTDINSTLHWKDYEAMKTHTDLYMGSIVTKLETYHLNEVEIRFCVLTLLDYRLRYISKILNYSYPSAIKTLKKRTSDKLGTTPPELKDFLLHLLPKAKNS